MKTIISRAAASGLSTYSRRKSDASDYKAHVCRLCAAQEYLKRVGESSKGWSDYAFPMRKTEVPQLGQTPFTAGLPFLSVTFCGFLISILVLHFTQYAVGISFSTERD